MSDTKGRAALLHKFIYGPISIIKLICFRSVGCIFAELVQMEPLFTGKSDQDQLSNIFKLLGKIKMDKLENVSFQLRFFFKVLKFFNVQVDFCLPDSSNKE